MLQKYRSFIHSAQEEDMSTRFKRAGLFGTLMCVSLVAAGCGSSDSDASAQEPGDSTVAGKKVCMDKFVSVPATDNAAAGAKAVLEAAGVNLVIKSSEGDAGTLQTILSQFLRDDCDLFMPLTTPGSQATVKAVKDKPIVFAGSSTPVQAGLVKSIEAPGGNATGVSDPFPVIPQIDAILKIDPSITSIGLIWKSGDPAGDPLAKEATDYLNKLGLKPIPATISNASEASQAAQSLVGKADAIMIPGSATAIAGAPAILKVANSNKIPVFGGDGSTVKLGGLLASAYDYKDVGEEGGKLVLRVLKGADPATTPVVIPTPRLSVNVKVAKLLGLTIPSGLSLEKVADQ
jgi:putative ABC transport system substrate-binding protein